MESNVMMAKSTTSRFFYGWIVVAAGFMVTGISYGMQYSFGVFFKPLLEDFGWTRVILSGVFSVYMVVHGGASIVMGGLSDRYGPRVVVATGGLIMGLSLIMGSRVQNIWHLYLFYGVFFGIGMGVAYVPLQSTVSRWFETRRGLAMGIVSSGSGAGTLILAPLSGFLISAFSWRSSYIILGTITCIIVAGFALLLRRSPHHMGLLPDGGVSQGKEQKKIRNTTQTIKADLTLPQAVRTIPFWIMIILFTSLGISLQMVMVHLIPYSTDIGIDKEISAVFLGLIGGCSMLGRLMMGSTADKIGGKNALLICIFTQIFCMFWLQIADNSWMIYLFTVFFGFSYGGWTPLLALMAGEFFGLRSLGLIIGVMVFAVTIGGAVGPLLAGYIYDVSGSYRTAFISGAIIIMIGFFATLFMKAPIKAITAE